MENANGHSRLVVLGCRENLTLFGRNGCVAVNQTGKDAAQRFNAEGKRGHVKQQDVFHIPLQDTGLHRSTNGHNFIRIHTFMRLFSEKLFNDILNLGHAGHATDQDHLVDFASRQSGILESFFAGLDGALHKIINQRFKFGAGQFQGQMFRTRRIRCNIREIDFGLGGG